VLASYKVACMSATSPGYTTGPSPAVRTLISIWSEINGWGNRALGSFANEPKAVTMLDALPGAAGTSQDAPALPVALHDASVATKAVAVMSAEIVRTDPLSSMP
jgi:hypothetical protein